MPAALDSQRLQVVFQGRPDLVDGITKAADSPNRIALFNDITNHVYHQLHNSHEPALKRRRVECNASNASSNAADEPVLLVIKDISVAAPQRKKFELCLTDNFLYARAPGATAPAPGIVYAWRDFEYLFYLPVPDKAQVQHNMVLFPRGTCLASKSTTPAPAEPLVFTLPASAPKEGTITGSEAVAAASVSDTYKSLFYWALEKRLRAVGNDINIVSADPKKFHSVIRQAHRPNEKAVHIGGFRGSKDGSLFFLENGILWGFKKPLIFVPLDRIVAVSYTNILQITFNIVIEVLTGEADATEEVEFGMLDQQDYGGVDNYVKLNHLQDGSMAEQRKGKMQLAENRVSKKDHAPNANGHDQNGLTELELAQVEAEQQLQDDEDEDEEDFHPGSEGESDGSGDSSDDDEDNEDEVDEDDGHDEQSEAEDEEEEDEEEDEVKQEIKQEESKPAKQEARAAKPTSQMPVRRGWATAARSSRHADDVDMEEKFDVVD
ncbi:hypothetical protein CDD82_3533 [Ophiocordyceps australis]|uniref:Histone chaperone RTT106/FACT complex subunit SPT16-like middle domain-containing protein n=1 Tax=Ophiocordyceps australis TaxID=1399860 RepID=A0A2C5Z6D2_9HYPO|nr:hypothetical protein CDD82_3533 [Ophiocordyceps australis]